MYHNNKLTATHEVLELWSLFRKAQKRMWIKAAAEGGVAGSKYMLW